MERRPGPARAGPATDGTIDILGVGWAFPVRPDVRGRLGMVRGDDTIERAIRLILQTAKGERVMRPEFGSDLHLLVFAENSPTTAGLAEYYVRTALARWEPRIEVLEVLVDWSEMGLGKMLIEISYRV